jgi:hypothetical protein
LTGLTARDLTTQQSDLDPLLLHINIDLSKFPVSDKVALTISQQPTLTTSTMAVTDGLAIKIVNIVV